MNVIDHITQLEQQIKFKQLELQDQKDKLQLFIDYESFCTLPAFKNVFLETYCVKELHNTVDGLPNTNGTSNLYEATNRNIYAISKLRNFINNIKHDGLKAQDKINLIETEIDDLKNQIDEHNQLLLESGDK